MDNSFFTLFFISNIILSVIFCTIIGIKKGLKKQITVSTQYHLSMISLLVLIAPFIPTHFLGMNDLIHFGISSSTLTNTQSPANMTETMFQNGNWQQDFPTSIEQSPYRILDFILFYVWLAGMIIMLLATLISNLRIYRVKKSLKVVDHGELSILLTTCKEEIDYQKGVVLGYSSLVKSPITFGLMKPIIVLPQDQPMLSYDDMRCVLLHELVHCKRKDILINYFLGLSRIVYWFNPLVWYFLSNMKTEMEITCDYAVLKKLDEESQLKYGEVILKFASQAKQTLPLITTSEISSSYKQVKRRIVTIVNFQVESKQQKIKSSLIFMAVLAIILSSIPSISVLAFNKDQHSFSEQNVVYKDYQTLFHNLTGSAVLYNTKMDRYMIYNEDESTTRYAPNSTYKIFSALFALENEIITKESSRMTWDGTLHKYDKWNQDQDLFTAMKNSTTWYFQHLDQQLGKKKLQTYYEQIGYGSKDISSDIANYWMDGHLKISPVEQIDMLKRFYNNEFSFDQSNIQTVKDSLLLEDSNELRLSGKTGTADVNGENVNGWFIGYVETADNTFFFAVHIEGEKDAGGRDAAKIALSILEKEGIYRPSVKKSS
ncbi:BlaR1 family beta-lactam sensor/signal transducer [Metabacillus sp. B2-18]|uniref:BlaR1 family beta-lactam sensor/signal transducer n=1 Tax=Metabacillus sp. B2-18 TaxID=2897333 RepID=UPI001E363BF1|nr:BlaR1 family beta-lactam sensor/signal transducer [Metabacillus sp. B2-18]UGB28852.1 BlaR1 family beta-lactam sensor/signal transducer [Metabacillus sp. B2-18]